MGDGWATWREAMARALYGPDGFFVGTPAQPRRHFRTSVHASPLFARAVAALAMENDLTTVVDVGSGGGELLTALHELDPRLRLVGVDLAPRPPDLARDVDWITHVPDVDHALVFANEWLDNVPLDVVVLAEDGPRLVEVDQEGRERPGSVPSSDDLAWLDRWWPLSDIGDRAEVGRTRDEAWSSVVHRVKQGLVVAVDYTHTRDTRPTQGTLTGYRNGRLVDPTPDGSCDLTAHVAIDSCAAAGEAAGATGTSLTTQADALGHLGVLPPRPDPQADPLAYLHAVRDAGELAELTDPGGLGGFTWLIQKNLGR